ncbi:MAG: hypothetical protein JWO89_2695 [Verrucomicrobiaceae bacterium]|nr:hypothetical protein [Verrucomicrobiaceae bacterium]
MKTSLIITLTAIGFSFGPRYLMAETVPPTTNPADHGNNVVPSTKPGSGTGTNAQSGTSGKNDPTSPADHGNNNATGKKVEGFDANVTDKPETSKIHKGKHKKTGGDDTNPGTPVNPADHGNNSTSGSKAGEGAGTGSKTTGNSSTGNPSPSDHGNNTGKGAPPITDKK